MNPKRCNVYAGLSSRLWHTRFSVSGWVGWLAAVPTLHPHSRARPVLRANVCVCPRLHSAFFFTYLRMSVPVWVLYTWTWERAREGENKERDCETKVADEESVSKRERKVRRRVNDCVGGSEGERKGSREQGPLPTEYSSTGREKRNITNDAGDKKVCGVRN